MMSHDEAADRVRELRELFPDYTPAKGEWLKREFRQADPALVDKAVTRYARTHSSLTVAPLLALIRDVAPKGNEAIRDSRAWKREHEQERAEITAALKRLSPAKLDALKAEVIGDMPEAARPFYRDRDPRADHMMRALIFQSLRNDAGGKSKGPDKRQNGASATKALGRTVGPVASAPRLRRFEHADMSEESGPGRHAQGATQPGGD